MNADLIKQRDEICASAQKIAATNLEDLFNSARHGTELSFESDRDVFRRCVHLAAHLTPERFAIISPYYYNALKNFVRDVAARLEEVREFSANRTDAYQQRQRLTGALDESYHEVFKQCPALSLIFVPDTSATLKALDKLRTDTVDSTTALLRETSVRFKATEVEIADVLAKARQASQSVASQGYARHFLAEAIIAQRIAWVWLALTLTGGITLIGFLLQLTQGWTQRPPTYTPEQTVLVGASKLALFSVGAFLVAWCGRNFKSQWHVFITNKHRANALNSIEAFANATKIDANREAILVHGCAAIFSQTATGFVPDGTDSPAIPSIMEVIRREQD